MFEGSCGLNETSGTQSMGCWDRIRNNSKLYHPPESPRDGGIKNGGYRLKLQWTS